MRFFRFFFKSVRFLLLIIIIFVIFASIYVYTSPKITINSANNIIMYDKNSNEFFLGSESKEWVKLKDINENLINSTIYTEDKNFYKHFGFDFFRIAKAFFYNIQNRKSIQGASTITQQYAKNLFLNFDKTWKRKWDEAWYTLRIEAHYNKDEILEGYLNTINYGHGKYGIENASKFYFGKSASELNLAEASILAGIPKSPSNYSPIIDFNMSKKRQLLVLNNLVKNNIITEDEKNIAYNTDLTIIGEDSDEISSNNNYYIDAVMNEIETIETIPKNYSEINGLKIYTNFDSDVQYSLEKNVKEAFPDESTLEVASVVMNPDNGGIMALVGGRDYNKSSYNRAIFSSRQVGSTMKPYLYYAALENGFTPSTSFISEKTTFHINSKDSYSPKNYNDKYGNKAISMATAIAYSDNIYAVKTHLFLGNNTLVNIARRVGIDEKLDDVPSLPLGTNEINIISMASGYSAFANLGYKVEGHFVEKVESGNGDILYEAPDSRELVLNPSLVFILNNILTSTYDPLYIDYNYPTAISLNGKLTHKYALKSGTTAFDNWNIGFNKNVLCAVWVGHDNNEELSVKDYKYAQNIWYRTVEDYEKNMNNTEVWYEKPQNVVGILVEPISGKPAKEEDKNKKLMYFLKGTEPKDTDPTFDEISNHEDVVDN